MRWAVDRRFVKENPKTTASGKEEDHSEGGGDRMVRRIPMDSFKSYLD